MKKNVLVFGIISGVVVSTFTAVSMVRSSKSGHTDMTGSMVVGFASMAVAFSFIFIGIKNYRDKQNEGVVTFGKAFLLGILISFVASTLYVLTWAIEFHFFLPDFMQKFEVAQVKEIQQSKMPMKEMEAALLEVATNTKRYEESPIYFAIITYSEIFPLGVLISLISAFILRRKTKKNNLEIINQ